MAWWYKKDCDFYDNPKVVAAGRDGREVFDFALAINHKHQLDGVIPADHLVARRIAPKLGMSVDAVREALNACCDPDVELLELREDGAYLVVGWDDEWRPKAQTAADRKRRQRAREAAQKSSSRRATETGQTVTPKRDSHAEPSRDVTKRDRVGQKERDVTPCHVDLRSESKDLSDTTYQTSAGAPAVTPGHENVTPLPVPKQKAPKEPKPERPPTRVEYVLRGFRARFETRFPGKTYPGIAGDKKAVEALPVEFTFQVLDGLLDAFFADNDPWVWQTRGASVRLFCERIPALQARASPPRPTGGYLRLTGNERYEAHDSDEEGMG